MAERTLTKAAKICRACYKIIDHPVLLFDPVDKKLTHSSFLWPLPSKSHIVVLLRKISLLYLISLMKIELPHGNDPHFCFWAPRRHACALKPEPRICVSGRWIIPKLRFLALTRRNAGPRNEIKSSQKPTEALATHAH